MSSILVVYKVDIVRHSIFKVSSRVNVRIPLCENLGVKITACIRWLQRATVGWVGHLSPDMNGDVRVPRHSSLNSSAV